MLFPARRSRCAALVPTVGANRRFPRSSHPQRLCRQHHKLPARLLLFSVCDATPAPGTVRLCTDFAPATMATASLTPSSLRHTARRGRLTLKPQADFRDSLSLRKLCDTPLCCLLQVRFTPSPSFNSATRRIVITAHRHVNPLDLIVSASRESGGCRAGQFSTNGNLTCTAAI